MSRPAISPPGNRAAGFTLLEVLAVMVVLGMMVVALSAFNRPGTGALELKAAAIETASRLRDLRSDAIARGKDRVAIIDVNARGVAFSDGRAPVAINRAIAVDVTAAESERRSPTASGIRFFPNGSSTGATIKLSSERQAYEVRVNWLTGRVSTRVLN
ncbi:GspH/FimT family pseudopilin [Hyphomicrobium facile]|uniref:Type II secretion system protein H n=1 Tax=Hyphomicrobium facile TaxID=51670 RepID=A0A1I7N4L9_9HYPH|nr:GspH/FimT family pseudopilin [Hyphomicrobium facile]SFV29604.1 general secretion pathway protein H [Hyphomicrobium facile]